MTVIIYNDKQTFADMILKNYGDKCKKPMGTKVRRDQIDFPNGDTYKAISSSVSCRGLLCDKIFVPSEISEMILNDVLIPMLRYSYFPQEEQIIYY